MPASLNQPIFVAIANGAAAEVTVRAHQPTLTTVSAGAGVASAASARAKNPIASLIASLLFEYLP